ncbi:MAG: Stp1/IreP family PP2C-type Ser/Thr phosphatase [Thermoleophilaceae bacterium]
MALRVTETVGRSDVGRQREANEDNYVVASPLFAVADGMGGAQAGEVASRTAADVFEGTAGDAGSASLQPEQLLTELTQEANRQIFEMAQSDPSRRGMGTTLTAAVVWSEGVSVGHVGDSRAYCLREGALEQLTHDHSLVAELQRSGQLTAEAAEHHPQRSIITRALGPEADVEVDTHTHTARAGDVFLLCSDGLTGMVSDAEMESILRGAESLDAAAEALVRVANQSGGKDNITVVLFRLGEDGGEGEDEEGTLSGSETIHQGLTADEVQAAVRERERAGPAEAQAQASSAGDRATEGRPSKGSHSGAGSRVRDPQGRGSPRGHFRRGQRTHARRSVGRRALTALGVLLVVGVIGAGAYLGARSVYFMSTDDAGLVTLYRGVPYELPMGIDLFSEHYASSVPARTLAPGRRERLLDHEWRSKADAEDLVRQLERGTLDTGQGAISGAQGASGGPSPLRSEGIRR